MAGLDGAGFIQLSIFGMEKFRVTIEGRNLDELYGLLMLNRVKSMNELGERTFDRPEIELAINKISIEVLTGPSPL